jgi:AcrR family transcriptional regulator
VVADRQEQRETTRARLLEAAGRVFARRGLHAATVDDIAAEAGFTKGAVYSNFDGKEDLFLAVLEDRLERRLRDVEEAFAGADSLAGVRGGGRQLAGLVEADRDLWLLFVECWVQAVRDPRLGRRFADLYRSLRQAVGRLVTARFDQRGIPLPAAPSQLAAAAIALAEGHALQKLIDPDRLPDEAYGDMLAYLVAGIAASGLGLDVDALESLRKGAGP